MTAQDLKSAILQLAVQGKLVPQGPNDEPVSELLKSIRAEKERLVKEGKIKKEKPLPPITEEEIPFEIPENWEWTRLGEIGDTNIGLTYKPSDQVEEGGTLVLRSSNIQNGKINYKDSIYVSCEIPEKAKISIGDLLICARNGSRALVGKCAIVDKSGMAFGAFMAKFHSECNGYIKIFIESPTFRNQLDGVKTETINQITQDTLRQQIIPLPPLAEQKRIVAKIEELMPLVEEYGKAEEQLTALNADFPDKLRKSILQQAIQGKLTERDPADEPASELLKRIRTEKGRLIKEGKIKKEKPFPPITEEEMPFEIPENWEWVRLGDLGETQTGTTPSTKDSRFFGKDIPFIKPADIFCDHINYDNEGLSYLGSEQSRIIQANSVMMVCIGGSIGKTYHNDRDVCCNQQINTITPIQCNTMFIWLVLSSNYFFEALQFRATGTATPIVNKNLWCNIPVPLPPLAEQQRIVDRVNELLALCDEMR